MAGASRRRVRTRPHALELHDGYDILGGNQSFISHMTTERTLILLKADAVERGLIGECVKRFEQRAFRIVGMKLVRASEEQMRTHYGENAASEEWLSRVGGNTIEALKSHGKDPAREYGTNDPISIGKKGIDQLVEFMTSGPIVAIVIEGQHAVEMVRKIVGHTMPMKADIGSIRGDFSIDSPITAALEKRMVQNLIHASGTVPEAKKEIAHWFTKEELI